MYLAQGGLRIWRAYFHVVRFTKVCHEAVRSDFALEIIHQHERLIAQVVCDVSVMVE